MASLCFLHSLLRTSVAPARTSAFTTRRQQTPSTTARTYHNTASLRLPYKDDQERDSVKPKAVEGGTSATDEATAETDAAFDPSKTSPEEQRAAADQETGKGDGGNPLDSSGANPEDSESMGEGGGPEMKETVKGGKGKASGHGSPQMKGKPPGTA